jgi:plastocyanin
VTVLALVACRAAPEPDTTLQPDSLLQAELGLTLDDRVHRVRVSGGEMERANPAETRVEPGAYVEFITTDWLIHEVIFEADSLSAEQWAFLERTDQVASPPLIDRESRYVLAFESAPVGRYPYTLEGNGRPGRGVIVVGEPPPETR